MKNQKERIKAIIKNEENDIKDIWRRIRKRDFSGNTGEVVKNSVYQISTTFFGKIGSFIFTIILARMLMPELFGLYSLALSTIIIFTTLSGIGINDTLIRFVSREFGKKGKNLSKFYLKYFFKIKLFLMIFSGILLFFSAEYLAKRFYQAPIFLALIAGIFYILFSQILSFFKSVLQSDCNFKSVFKREIAFQISRIILVPLGIFFAIKYSLSDELNLMFIILFLSISFLIASFFLFFDIKKTYFKKIKDFSDSDISKKDKKQVKKFLLAAGILALSGTFFGNIDRVMLGRFLDGEFIGYYTAASTLISSVAPLIGFSATVLLPTFSKLSGKSLEFGFKKSLRKTFIFGTISFFITIIFSYFIILIVYGKNYIPSLGVLRILSPLLIIVPLISIYYTYFLSQGKPQIVAKFLFLSTIINIFLNYFLITSFMSLGQINAVYGAAIATTTSQFLYLSALIIKKRKLR